MILSNRVKLGKLSLVKMSHEEIRDFVIFKNHSKISKLALLPKHLMPRISKCACNGVHQDIEDFRIGLLALANVGFLEVLLSVGIHKRSKFNEIRNAIAIIVFVVDKPILISPRKENCFR